MSVITSSTKEVPKTETTEKPAAMETGAAKKQTTKGRDYSTSHFKHENNPRLKEMREDWTRQFEEKFTLVKHLMDTGSKEELNELKKGMDAFFKEQKTLWSSRELRGLE